MKEKKTVSTLKRVLLNCASQVTWLEALSSNYTMPEEASDEQSQGGISGFGALSHVYMQYPPLRCNAPGTQRLYYDNGNKLLLAPLSDHVLSYKVGTSQLDPHSSDFVGGGPVLFIRYSLDAKLIGIHRSNHEIQFKNRESGQIFSHICKTDTERILGFFWTDCPSCDLILIKTRLFHQKAHYNDSVRLPKFEMTMVKSEANHNPVLAADVHIVTIYGRIYFLQCDRVAMQLNLYRFYSDAVVQQIWFEKFQSVKLQEDKRKGLCLFTRSRVAVSVIDNVLLVHQVDAKVVIINDIFLDSLSPISAPLPLLLRCNLVSNRQGMQVEDSLTSAYSAMIYGDNWIFLVPDLVCDIDNSLLWRICLDLESIAASSSNVLFILEFLQRQRSDPGKGGNISSKRTKTPTGQVTTTPNFVSAESSGETMNRRKSVIEVAENGPKQSMTGTSYDEKLVILKNLESYLRQPSLQSEGLQCGSTRTDSGVSNQLDTQPTSVAISLDEMFQFAFAPVEEELRADLSYLIAVIMEFLHCSMKEKLKVPPDLFAMVIQVRSNRHSELALFVINKILEPSKEVALQLLEQGRQNLKFGSKVWIRLGSCPSIMIMSPYCCKKDSTLKLYNMLENTRGLDVQKVITVQPSLFLEAANVAHNSQHLAAVLRLFSDSTVHTDY
ncbi:hypothetical protein ZIOFF_071765 [Zingiber officinale]|uniref:Mic1 domain-containing protein n=1 Tax=Zingiber officinale TaxID=94328 RepID=A0A8J5EQR3_ZINOF|nr:hypothetical protein ZIOFF_071765 [Zingiber officinale]